MAVTDVLEEWDAYAQKKELKNRDIDLETIKARAEKKIVSITGVRRAGKTSLLMLLRQNLKNAAYVNLEDSRLRQDDILDKVIKWFGDSGYLLLDEITNVTGWEDWLYRNHEMLQGSLHLIVSSSRKSLAEPKKALRGRMLSSELYPLSFKEFLDFKAIEAERTTAGTGKIEKALQEYLKYGGFPEVSLLGNKTEKVNLLNSYFRDIMGLDVAEISGENVSLIEKFGDYVVNAPYFSASKCHNFFKSLGYKTGKQKLLDLEKFFQDSYLMFFVPIFSRSVKDRSQYQRKAYLSDSGFYYSVKGELDWGRIYENAVYMELKRKERNKKINYWKNKKGKECDFVVRKGLKPEKAIQVVYNLENEKTKKREIAGLVACLKNFDLSQGLIITKDVDDHQSVDNVEIDFVPLWRWLLTTDQRS